MTIKNYGVWKGTPVSYKAQTLKQDRSPHINLKFDGGEGNREHEANINVASTDKDHDLVYWLHRSWHHPLTKTLTHIQDGFHRAETSDGTGLSLDYVRTKPQVLDFSAGCVLPNYEKGPNNDILDQLEPILNDAIKEKAKIYIFGSEYSDQGGGIHDM
jgi:uncharacterized protein YukJ